MKAVLAERNPHIVTAKPNGAPAAKSCIAAGEHNLLISAHAQDFVRLDHGRLASCFDRVREDPLA